MMTAREQLIRDIEAAFRSVERGNGLTLHELAEFEGNDYCTARNASRITWRGVVWRCRKDKWPLFPGNSALTSDGQ